MEKRTAHYDLSAIVVLVRQRRAVAFTKTALDGGRRMGLTVSEMIEVSAGSPRAASTSR